MRIILLILLVAPAWRASRLDEKRPLLLGLDSSVCRWHCGSWLTFQVLAYNGYVNVNWKKVESDIMGKLDVNGDGKVGTW